MEKYIFLPAGFCWISHVNKKIIFNFFWTWIWFLIINLLSAKHTNASFTTANGMITWPSKAFAVQT